MINETKKQNNTVVDSTRGDHSAIHRRAVLLGTSSIVATAALTSQALAQAQKAAPSAAPAAAPAAGRKPNILVIFGDDIGIPQISAYTMGMMGYRTPNIDRIAREGAIFTDSYGQQSCTAGRASFILGQEPFRTGLLTIGMPGDPHGIQDWMPTIADVMKTQGYATGQFGKNHLGDRDEHLPTKHGFDEFFGNLYHLNAEEEPEGYFYPKDPNFRKQFGPRGVIKSTADGKIEDTGPLNTARMPTVDEEFLGGAKDFIGRQARANRPFFCWFNSTRMHFRTHVRADHRDQPGVSARTEYADGMIEHDNHVGLLLKKIDDLGLANDTIVIYTTDNGPHMNSWPDGAMTWFRSEKNTNWEGAFRVPCMIRWPGRIRPGQLSHELISGLDWCPTLLAAAGDADIKQKLLTGHQAAGKTFKVHLDGYNQLPYLTGQQDKSARPYFIYFNDDADLVAMRFANWKLVFEEQRSPGTLLVWGEPFTKLRIAKFYDLHADPFERADITSNTYWDWLMDHAYLQYGGVAQIAEYLETYKEYPPSQKPASFSVEGMMQDLHRVIDPKIPN